MTHERKEFLALAKAAGLNLKPFEAGKTPAIDKDAKNAELKKNAQAGLRTLVRPTTPKGAALLRKKKLAKRPRKAGAKK